MWHGLALKGQPHLQTAWLQKTICPDAALTTLFTTLIVSVFPDATNVDYLLMTIVLYLSTSSPQFFQTADVQPQADLLWTLCPWVCDPCVHACQWPGL